MRPVRPHRAPRFQGPQILLRSSTAPLYRWASSEFSHRYGPLFPACATREEGPDRAIGGNPLPSSLDSIETNEATRRSFVSSSGPGGHRSTQQVRAHDSSVQSSFFGVESTVEMFSTSVSIQRGRLFLGDRTREGRTGGTAARREDLIHLNSEGKESSRHL